MSIHIMSRCWDNTRAKGTHLLLLLALSDFANDHGVCWPGIPRLAQRMRVSQRQAQRAVNNLEAAGELYVRTVSGGRKHYNLYLVAAGRLDISLIEALVAHFDVSPLEAAAIADDMLRRQRQAAYGPPSPIENDDIDVTVSDEEIRQAIANGDTDDTVSTAAASTETSNNGDTHVTLSDASAGETVTSGGRNGDIAVSPEPSLTVKNHHLDTRANQDDGSAHTRARDRGESPERDEASSPDGPHANAIAPPAAPPRGTPLPPDLWTSIRYGLRLRMPHTTWDQSIRDLDAELLDSGQVLVIARSWLTVDVLARRIDPLIREEIARVIPYHGPDKPVLYTARVAERGGL